MKSRKMSWDPLTTQYHDDDKKNESQKTLFMEKVVLLNFDLQPIVCVSNLLVSCFLVALFVAASMRLCGVCKAV